MIAIATFESAFGEIEIMKRRATGSRVYLQAGGYQTILLKNSEPWARCKPAKVATKS